MAVCPINGMALCAGAGGLELALHIALDDDYRCVVYVEREAYAAATLVARMADQTLDPAPVWDDLLTFDGRPWRGVVDLVSAGFSCQPWSAAGKRLGIEDERWLWPDIDRVIREVRPEWVFLENVPGLVHGGIEHVLGSLAAQGFAAEWDCVSAAEVGASQLRERLYILARSPRGGLGMVREPSWSRGQLDGPRQAVANGSGERSGETRRVRGQQPLRPGRSGSVMADADATGFSSVGRVIISSDGEAPLRDDTDGRECPSGIVDDADARRRGRQDHEIRSGRSRPERTEPSVGNADGPGCRMEGDDGRLRSARPDAQLGESHCSRLPRTASARPQRFAADAGYWPPDRNYRGEWPSGFEPAVRRVADGMGPWVDRLRLTGNGVVPLGAAVAFLRLRDRLTA